MSRIAEPVRAHPHLVLAAAAGAGLALAPAPADAAWVAAAACAAALGGLRLPFLAAASALVLLAAGALGHARLAAIDGAAAKARPGATLEARAELLERPRASPFGSSAALRVVSGPARGARVHARAGRAVRWPAGGEPGAVLAVRGALRRPRSPPEGDFDFAAHLRRRGIAAELMLQRVKDTGARRGGIAGAVDSMRRRSERALSAGLGHEDAALSRGMVLGQDEAISPLVRDDFRASGLGHLLAVSGQNVMLLCALALPLLAAAGLGVRGRIAALAGLIAVYVPLAGAGPSLQRAAVMGAAGLAALALGRPASRWYALLLAAAATLALNPRVCGDAGWQLSFAAVVGILVLAAPLQQPLRALPRPLAGGIAITVAATLATAPLAAHHFGVVSIASLAANLVAIPAVAPVMWIGMLQAALAQLGSLGWPLDPLAGVAAYALGRLAAFPLGFLQAVAGRFAELPWAQASLPLRSPLAVAAVYTLMGAAILTLRAAARRYEAAATGAVATWRLAPVAARRALAVAAVAGLALLVWRAAAPPAPPAALTVSFLDVGQGDATLIQHPDGSALLFDGGPPEARVARLLRRAGVRRLGAVVATHASADHHGGLAEVLDRFPVDLLVDGGDGTQDRAFRALLADAAGRGIRRVPATAGQTLRAGSLTVRILSPPRRPPGPPPEDPNPRAVAAVVSAGGFDLFLSGDAESPALLPLALPDVEAMKVPHHGSGDPGLPDLLRRLRPEVAAIEVGEGNGYGHPAPETLRALATAVPRVYRTDRDGTVRLTLDRGGMRAATER